MIWFKEGIYYVKNTCFSPTMHIYVQIFEYLCGKMLDWGFCFLNVMAKDKYDAERRDIGARTNKDPDGNEL